MSEQLSPSEKDYLQNQSERTTKGAMTVSQYAQTFSANTTLGFPDLLFQSVATGSGTIVNPTENSPWVGLQVTTASGDDVVYQSKNPMTYSAYRTHRASFALSFATPIANLEQHAGMFDANDGWFFKLTEAGLSLVVRSATSGSPVETEVASDDFNLDKLDGSGPSGLRVGRDFHLDRGLTLGVSYNWYGTQKVEFYLAYGGSIVPLHEFIFTGQVAGVPFTRTASLPLRFQITNTGAAASGSTMRVGTVAHSIADGATRDLFNRFSASNGTTGVTASSTTVWQDILAVRAKTTFNGITNRALLDLLSFEILSENNGCEYRIIDNVTYTGGTWNSVDDNSAAEFSSSPGTQSGTPRAIEVSYIFAGRNDGQGAGENPLNANIKIAVNTVDGSQPAYVIQARKLSATDATVYASISWKEEY